MIEYTLLADLVTELPQGIRLQRLVETIRTQFCCGAVALLRLDGDSLRPEAAAGLVREALGRRFLVAQHPRLTAILADRQPVSFDHDTTLPDPYDGLLESNIGEPLPVHDCMGVSLYVDGEQWGALTLDALTPGTFDPQARDDLARCTLMVEAAIRMTRLEQERRHLRQLPRGADVAHPVANDTDELLGRSRVMQLLLAEIDVVAAADLPVLLTGETGVGKDLCARRLHYRSARADAPLIHVNCAALPESLAESELFGHIKGAFSGAESGRAGRVEAASGGTLFLDEVGELPLTVQAKLLRTLQNGEIQRLGEDKPRHVDVRIIAATNRQLQERVREGQFRADLYHRLSVYPIPIPPLRERDNDVLLLAGFFLEQNRARLGIRSLRLSAAAEQMILRYPWPGNVRELEHVLSRAALKAVSFGARRDTIVTLDTDLLDLSVTPVAPVTAAVAVTDTSMESTGSTWLSLRQQVENCQRQAIRTALEQHHQNWAAAARVLELDPSNLHKLARKLGLKP
ncbi:nitric oxide reductase transcriptional regulator NorR [Gynuella sunshinyii]|uniref:Transcriptional regulator containing GAF, AAA-type ATPase, and DNA binding domain n=1 Tax=Gynuella sunshinyii YC6258 TaxID=1445510 RepID=A0A0C5VJA6_9GAMM|nr:nitric oxide reductase transcriptional regulator NorR [Gynuella sunshinyii]AJQ94351.1 transcriptional regulator containing GAF, AAA-type ATPase, and DNA binding domain [Gynuella sunshinyii YC6258]